jgi:hypothetical protein
LDLSLRYEHNGTAHDDLFLHFEGQSWVCDSYYFAIDWNFLPGDESTEKVRAVLRKLLEQWLSTVMNLSDGGTAFLPYDFSDEYTGWLCCQRNGDEMTVLRGWALVQGHGIFPSAIGKYLTHLPEFKADGPTAKSSKEVLLQAIRDSLAQTA